MGGFLACILAGAAMSIQGVMNTRLSEHIGTMETNAFVQCVAAVLSLLVLVFWRTGSFAALGAAPKYCWFGGVLALAITVTVMLGMGRLGPTLAVATILIAQLATAAAIDFLRSPNYNTIRKRTPDIYFIGNSFSGSEILEVISLCEGKDVSVNVVSKSGTTTESAIAFRVMLSYMQSRYSKDELRRRIFATTDAHTGALKQLADENGFETYVVPEDIGGRFSVLSAVGLLPIAVCGADIDKILAGAAAEREALFAAGLSNDAYKYALYRNAFLADGKEVEILCSYEPALRSLTEWWKQLFGESEGKDGKGIFPASAIFSTDLHSMGQYIQDGRRMLFETVVRQTECGCELKIPFDESNVDKLNYIAGESLFDVNEKAFLGTLYAHRDGGVPSLVVEYGRRDEESFGALVYFFCLACAASAYILGVNPFNQPGVEAYKKNMFALLGKEGYEKEREALMAKINS